MKKYECFQELMDTMRKYPYNYEKEVEAIKKVDTAQLKLSDHVKSMIYAELSNNRPWERIAENIENGKLPEIFYNFNVDQVKKADPKELIQKITDIHCGNRQIKMQMKTLKENINTLEKIDSEFNGISNYIKSFKEAKDLVKDLSNPQSKHKLHAMGIPLVCEYLKGVGAAVVKPDVHICRILGRLGLSRKGDAKPLEAIEICDHIANEYKLPHYMVDTVLWQYCADGKFEVCCKKPKCEKCRVKNCPSRVKAFAQS